MDKNKEVPQAPEDDKPASNLSNLAGTDLSPIPLRDAYLDLKNKPKKYECFLPIYDSPLDD